MEDPLGIAGVLIALNQIRNNFHVLVSLEQAVVGHLVQIVTGYRVVQVGGNAGSLVGSRDDQGILRGTACGSGITGISCCRLSASRFRSSRCCCRLFFSAAGTACEQTYRQGQRHNRHQAAHKFFRHTLTSRFYLHGHRPDAS